MYDFTEMHSLCPLYEEPDRTPGGRVYDMLTQFAMYQLHMLQEVLHFAASIAVHLEREYGLHQA